MRLLVVGDTNCSPNQGCQAVSASIRDAFSQIKPKPSLEFIGVEELAPVAKLDSQGYWKFASKDFSFLEKKLLHKIQQCDAVIINGEGAVLENYRTQKLNLEAKALFSFIRVSNYFKKPCHLINFTAHLTTKDNRNIASQYCSMLKTVWVREPWSYYNMKPIWKHLQLFPDLACLTRSRSHVGQKEGNSSYVMLGGSSAIKHIEQMGHVEEAINCYSKLVDTLLDYFDEIHLMGWNSASDNLYASDNWLEKYQRKSVKFFNLDHRDYANHTANATLQITGRHHAIVMGAMRNCPFMAFEANCYKTTGDNMLYGGLTDKVYKFKNFNLSRFRSTLASKIKLLDKSRYHLQKQSQLLEEFALAGVYNCFSNQPDLIDSGIYARSKVEKLLNRCKSYFK